MTCSEGALGITRRDHAFHLGRAGRGARFHRARIAQEVVQRPSRPRGDELQRFDGRLRLTGLDEVDGGSAYLGAGPLAQAEDGFEPCLLDSARPDLDSATAAATARGWLGNLHSA